MMAGAGFDGRMLLPLAHPPGRLVLVFQEATAARGCARLQRAVAIRGNTFPARQADSGRLITDDDNMPEISSWSAAGLKPLDPELTPEVRTWVGELREVWQATGLSMGQFAVRYPFDKGTISRYLSGQRVPGERHFLDMLLSALEINRQPVTPTVRDHLTGLQMRALQAAHPHEYRVRLVKDELEIALTSKLEAERYTRALEGQLAERNREIQELTADRNRLRVTLDTEYARLTGEIETLAKDLDLARSRSTRTEQRCMELESVLDFMGQTYPDQRQEDDVSRVVLYPDWCRIVMHLLPPDDLYAVADFLSMLYRLGLHDQAVELADRVIGDVSHRLHSPDDMTRQGALLPLLATIKRLGLDEQADRLSAVLGYTGSHWKRRNTPVDGRFS
jgi:transcriptional regulator with XRE-family HTH domain